MPNLITDFVNNGGTYMVITASDGLHSGQINRVQRRMLASVNIPNLLRIDVREVNFSVSLHYEITGKRMLSQCLKHEKIGMDEWYSLLLQVVSIFDDCKQYMLSPTHFIMDSDHIFVEEPLSSGVLYFTYVPIMDKLTDKTPAQLLTSLITKMLTSVAVIEGDGVQQLLRLCSEESFSSLKIKKTLLDLLAGDRQEPKKSPVMIKEYIQEEAEDRVTALPIDSVVSSTANNSVYHSVFTSEADSEAAATMETATSTNPMANSSIKTYLMLGAAVLIALIWKFVYLDHPADLTLYLSLGFTAVIILLVLLWSKGKLSILSFPVQLSDDTKEREAESWEKEWKWEDPPLQVESSFMPHSESQPELQTSIESQAMVEPVRNVQATVLLTNSQAPPNEHHRSDGNTYILHRSSQNSASPETIPLQRGSFVIGRSEDIAQYVDPTPGVSRAHVELMIRREGCSLKDLGSVNGTTLRGELIAPYKEYSLNSGDYFMIADSTYTLRKENG